MVCGMPHDLMGTSHGKSVAAVIVAAGRGSRAGETAGPKQYRQLGGTAVLRRTLDVFLHASEVDRVVVCIHPDDAGLYEDCTPKNDKLLPPVFGGATRQLSVLAGLEALAEFNTDHVLIHDAARPFVSEQTIRNVLTALENDAAALPGIPIADTLKQSDDLGLVDETVSRENLYAAQTPQGFHFSVIMDAHRKANAANRDDFTDDAALAEWAGISVRLVEGNAANTKLTTNENFEEAERRMRSSMPDVRTGHGYDTHQLVDGDHITLCGVEIPFTHKLSGHSDADVGLHALTDALLGTIGDGDIGSHFPPSDAKWKGAQSDQFLSHAASLVRAQGGTITHCDVTLICEAPKIGPHRQAMREAIARILDIESKRVSVKATTNERIGFIGREEGMVALATATVVISE